MRSTGAFEQGKEAMTDAKVKRLLYLLLYYIVILLYRLSYPSINFLHIMWKKPYRNRLNTLIFP